MFERELREEQRTLDTLSTNVRRTISRFESEVNNLRKQFNQSYGLAEKEIDAELNALKGDLDKLCKDIEKEVNNNLEEGKKSLCRQEEQAFSRLNDYKKSCKLKFDQKALSMMIVKGDL